MANMLQPTTGIAPQTMVGLSAPAQASAPQQPSQAPTQQQQAAATQQMPSQISNPQQLNVPPATPGMPNARPNMDPMLLQQILSTMLLQPQESIGGMMQPQNGPASAPTAGPIPGIPQLGGV